MRGEGNVVISLDFSSSLKVGGLREVPSWIDPLSKILFECSISLLVEDHVSNLSPPSIFPFRLFQMNFW